jgi:Carboxypeptidase regulatory-like domain
MHRTDVRELNAALQSLARLPILSAFRYQRTAATPAALTMDVKRFADAGVLAAVADRAVATTLVTSEGRVLTEIALQVQNRAQPFLKVALPAGATIVSVEVAGETAKPMVGADGTRVPLLRPGFRPNGSYRVAFVYLHAGTPFLRKGDMQMTLPRMDIPVGIVEWELFVPELYSVRATDGNVIDRAAFPVAIRAETGSESYRVGMSYRGAKGGVVGGVAGEIASSITVMGYAGLPGQIRGRAVDAAGAAVPGVTIAFIVGSFRHAAMTAADGTYLLSGLPSGVATITAQMAGFRTQSHSFNFDQTSKQVDFVMSVSAVEETVTVSGESPAAQTKAQDALKPAPPSQNVINLQRRAAGVLPVRVDVPRAGVSHQFVKPLVVDQETVVSLRYKRR